MSGLSRSLRLNTQGRRRETSYLGGRAPIRPGRKRGRCFNPRPGLNQWRTVMQIPSRPRISLGVATLDDTPHAVPHAHSRPKLARLRASSVRCAISVAASIAVLSACGGSSADNPTLASAIDKSSPLTTAGTGERVQAAGLAGTALAAIDTRPALPNLLPSLNDSGFAVTFSLS